jgi:hypothetical protein
MRLGLRHNLECRLIHGIAWPIPVENHSVDTAADHVVDLGRNFCRIGGVVSDVHVVRLAEPENHVRINLRGRARVEQRVNIHLAHISGAEIAVRQGRKTVRRACVVGGLSG